MKHIEIDVLDCVFMYYATNTLALGFKSGAIYYILNCSLLTI